ncbi:phospholipase D-like domain-containing protein [Burkholderia stagnalis]|uniref:phospholipase D-like domain-containing protein n=1 Tax=Burkholderia stagnalis TaxID=1503054 RepID=UPI000755912D|nr:phospholipase D-like domain-containing protein [Burkholderia stagnalis]KVO51991.1 phospholipase [Burkholderia stagnalis]KVP10958.1 phospholipase [Burkholderia stagnalis]KVW98670.1 phospholipase [Burkholderia stagnalis]KWH83053.1 phospholipase [Burkholderia stagnalis]KWK21886.1 phospholipase [Burkholderia stagnalis]
MSQPAAITVPIAQSSGNTATLTLPHFVQGAEYKPRNATHHPLVNGEEAFGAVYDAIAKAQYSVDMVCWGFQPSMYFKRGSSGQGSLSIGELLLERAKQNVKVRLLVWGDKFHVAQFMENMMPGGRFSHLPDNRNSAQWEFDAWWYEMVKMDKKNMAGTEWTGVSIAPVHVLAQKTVRRMLRDKRDPAFKNIEFATRDFDMNERAEIAWRTATDSQYSERSTNAKIQNGVAMGLAPSHHQKMVLVDYEYPELATGFVMGHNTLDEYWDNSRHGYLRMHPQMGRNGFLPRQDISARVTGPILIDLNKNFCQAWDATTGQQLEKQRASAEAPLLRRSRDDLPVMAQILRTQPQVGKNGIKDIERLYFQAINNTANFVYIENQYFRFPPLAEKLTKLVKAYQAGGRKTPLYLFVVTNSSDDGIGFGTVSTYHMLNALGRADVLPGVAKLERADELEKQYKEALAAKKRADQAYERAKRVSVDPFSGSALYALNNVAAAQLDAVEAAQRVNELKVQLDKARTEDPEKLNTPGLKVHICTLVPPDTPKGKPWDEVYIHSKLMIIDDVFVTHGSANVNLRSMEVDSELNIVHESVRVTQPLREKLWRIHAGENGVGAKDKNGRLNAESAFQKWDVILSENNEKKSASIDRPCASLVEFYRENPSRSYLD